MEKQFAGKLDTEISRYKQALSSLAKACDSEDIQLNASTLLNYLESFGLYLVKRKFHQFLEIIFGALVLFSALGNSLNTSMINYRGPLSLNAGSAFLVEMILLFELKLYMNVKALHQKKEKKSGS